MKLVLLALLVCVAAARPDYGPASSEEHGSETLRNEFDIADNGAYTADMETSNGIVMSQSGSPTGPEDAILATGYFSWTAPDGTPVSVKYVADENGYQPDSDILPVAPEFPHPIPQFVLDQIEKARKEDLGRSSEEYRVPTSYRAP
ncbi:hypothetical protein Pcinc_036315 [Petrolisthes cinctipes]|uniref:Uncharacterized protein n=1 Tax=Petrolisthes cinctipes TaxID=88211 RepID=A0AAE1BUQ5_PETCI|nr:hypothetical protein Pcinc_036315 [Petrolisthes cinctipes]